VKASLQGFRQQLVEPGLIDGRDAPAELRQFGFVDVHAGYLVTELGQADSRGQPNIA
jgi:hypothetical protein